MAVAPSWVSVFGPMQQEIRGQAATEMIETKRLLNCQLGSAAGAHFDMRKVSRVGSAKRRPLKIAMLGSRGIPHTYSGYETFLTEVGPRLVERGHEVLVYCRRSLFRERPKTCKGV